MKLQLNLFEHIFHKRENKTKKDVIAIDRGAAEISGSNDSNKGYLVNVQRETQELCTLLNNDTFDKVDFFEKMYAYVEQDNRLVYSSITNYIFSLGENRKQTDQIVSNIITNLQMVIDYTGESGFEKSTNDKKTEIISKTNKYLLKLWDHINLAQRQFDQIAFGDEYYQNLAEESVKEATKPISDELNKQLISLVAIFTALSFVVFGGISSLSGIFAAAHELPVLKVLMFGSLWAICMINLVFMFMFFISNLVEKSIASSNNINDSCVKKYPLIFFSNWIFVTVLVFSLGAYYWEENRLMYSVIKIWKFVVPVIEVVFWLIVAIDIIIGIVLVFKLFKA